MTEENPPSSPTRESFLPAPGDDHYQLYRNVREAISSLPIYFRTETHISGILATDLHTLNSVLGATIKEQVVRTLNLIRNTWDSDGSYALYTFIRQAQTFPDVLLLWMTLWAKLKNREKRRRDRWQRRLTNDTGGWPTGAVGQPPLLLHPRPGGGIDFKPTGRKVAGKRVCVENKHDLIHAFT